jgi:type IV pilus assembly protein PilC
MEKFRYKALDASGATVSGTEEALTRNAAHLALLDRGFESVQISQRKSFLQFEITKKKVSRKDLMHFSRQLGVFVKAGIPIMEALEVIGEETQDKLFKAAIHDMIDRLQAGDTFASAAGAHPEVFPNFYLGILGSAELTGTLDVVLEQLADYIERDVEARGKITGALIYPAVVFIMSIVTVVILTAFVLPRFKTFFDSFHATLPLPTRILLSFANFFASWWWAIVLGVIALFIAGLVLWRDDRGRAWLDSILLKAPVAGDLVQAVIMERICRILSSMIHAGVALPEAMSVTAEASNNAVYKLGLEQIREEMMEGQGLSEPVSRSGLFPGAARQMFRVGEETGTLDEQLDLAAAYYNREVDIRVKRFTSLFEPAVIIFMGLIVGFVAVALVSAMYGIYHQVHIQ